MPAKRSRRRLMQKPSPSPRRFSTRLDPNHRRQKCNHSRSHPVVPVLPPRPIAKPGLEPPLPGVFPRPVQNVFEAQLALARQGISSGSLDGLIGPQTRAALRAFQQKEHLPVTGELDPATKERLLLATAPYATYTVTTNDLARLQPLSPTWLGKSQQTALDYRDHPGIGRREKPRPPEPHPPAQSRPSIGPTSPRARPCRCRTSPTPTRRQSRLRHHQPERQESWKPLTRTPICSRTSRAASPNASRSGPSANCTSPSSPRTRTTPSTRTCSPNPPRRGK